MKSRDQKMLQALLAWFDRDREHAAERYAALREKLTFFLEAQGAGSAAEDLADRTLDILARKLADGLLTPADGQKYCWGIARNVLREHSHGPAVLPLMVEPASSPPDTYPEHEQQLRCLDACLERLPADQRSLAMGGLELMPGRN